jgi:integrase
MKISRVTVSNGRYFYIRDLEERSPKTGRPKKKWEPLTRVSEGEPALLAALQRLLAEPVKAKDDEGNIREWVKAFEAAHYPTLTPGVREEYRRQFVVIAESFKDFDVAEVEPGDVLDFLSTWADKPTARHHYKGRLSTFFSYCVLHKGKSGVAFNPCREIRMGEGPKKKGKMNAERFWRMRDALPDVGRCFLDLIFLCRQRPTEIRRLKESAITPDRVYFLPTKTEKKTAREVVVAMTPEIAAVLEHARKLQKVQALRDAEGRFVGGDVFVMQTPDGGEFTRWSLRYMWDEARTKAGLDEIGVTSRHVRPFALKAMEDLGVDIREIQKAAAHASVTTTEGYLDQHRDRLVDVRLALPPKPKSAGNG